MKIIKTILPSLLLIAVFALGTYFWYRGNGNLLGATILTTNSTDTISTFRTNVNTSLTNLNNVLGATTTSNTWAGTQTFTNASATALTVSGSTYLTGLGQGWLHTAGGVNALTSSTSPTVNYIVATSTTATSTFAGDINIGSTSNILQGGQRFLTSSTTSAGNLTIGYQSATNIDANGGLGNTGVGYQALGNATSTSYNTALGYQALKGSATISGTDFNTAVGYQALLNNTTGSYNTANGVDSLRSNTTGSYNTANGVDSLRSNTTGNSNIANGYQSLRSNTTGSSNAANGYISLYSNTTGNYNTAYGHTSFYSNTTGTGNVSLGYRSGYGDAATADQRSVIDDYATFIGYQASRSESVANTIALTNITAIGKNARVGASNSIVLGGTGADAVNVGIGTTSPYARLSVVGETVAERFTATSTATSTFAGSLAITEANATSTFAGGLDLSDGCFAIDGTCLGAGGSGTVTSIATTFPVLGGIITTTGTLSFGGLSTSTAAVVGNLPYFSGVNTFANTGTTSLTATSPLSLSQPISVIGSSASALTISVAGDWTGTIDSNNFAGGAIGAGELIYGGSAGSFSELALGTAGYVLALSGGIPAWVATTSIPVAGDVTGTLSATVVGNDSHDHTSTTISGIDISADTNLTGGRSLTLTDDDILADAELYTYGISATLIATTTSVGISTTTENFISIRIPNTSTITSFNCYADDIGTSTVKATYASNPISAGTNILYTTGVNCGSDLAIATTTFSNTAITAGDYIKLYISDASPTGSRPRIVYPNFTLTKND